MNKTEQKKYTKKIMETLFAQVKYGEKVRLVDDVSEYMEVSRPAVYSWKKGEKTPKNIKRFSAMLKLYGIDLAEEIYIPG